MLRFGIMSTAKIAREALIPAILDADNCVLSAIASRDINRANEVATRFNIPHTFGSYEEMLASDLIDAVYIPLPTSQHAEWAIKAADAGKHVLCEKPIALKAEDIDGIIAARDRNKVLVTEAYMVTYAPLWRKVRELVADGAIGKLRHVTGAFSFFLRDPNNTRNIPEMGGGALPDIGVYPSITTRFVTGMEPTRLRATVKYDPDFGTDIYSSVLADFGDFELSFYVSTQMAVRQQMVFHGEEGFIEVKAPFNANIYDAEQIEVTTQWRQESTIYRFNNSKQYRVEVETFAKAAAGENVEVVTLENSRKNQQMIDAIYRAGKTDGWETV